MSAHIAPWLAAAAVVLAARLALAGPSWRELRADRRLLRQDDAGGRRSR